MGPVRSGVAHLVQLCRASLAHPSQHTLRCAPSDVEYRHLVDDELMRFFERCRKYVEGVENNRTALQEVEKFKEGEEMEELRRKTARKLGVQPHLLTPGQTLSHSHTHNQVSIPHCWMNEVLLLLLQICWKLRFSFVPMNCQSNLSTPPGASCLMRMTPRYV